MDYCLQLADPLQTSTFTHLPPINSTSPPPQLLKATKIGSAASPSQPQNQTFTSHQQVKTATSVSGASPAPPPQPPSPPPKPQQTHCTFPPIPRILINTSLTAALGGESYPFTLNSQPYSVTFSALLPGHDDWVFTVHFHPLNPDILLSSSADASLIIWRPEETSGIWIPETRLGEVSSLKGATTAQGSTGGFWGGVWGVGGDYVASWGKTGGWRVWRDEGNGEWIQRPAVGGAIRAVKGISWDHEGRFLFSTRYVPLFI